MTFFVLFGNDHFHNVVSRLTNAIKLDIEKGNVVSILSNVIYINVEIRNVYLTLFDVVNSNVETRNVASTFIWRFLTSRRNINQKTTLKQHWNVWWEVSLWKKLWVKVLYRFDSFAFYHRKRKICSFSFIQISF